MNNKKLAATLGITAITLTGCGIFGEPVCVYGPAPEILNGQEDTGEVSEEVNDLYYVPEYNPEDDEVVEVYGPIPSDVYTEELDRNGK